jgi:hypothetical protein
MPGKTTFTLEDFGDEPERSSVQIYHVQLTAANFDATAGGAGLINDFQTALAGITIGSMFKRVINAEDTLLGSAAATNAFAQRETKWLCTYTDDSTGRRYQVEIPCADLDLATDGKNLDLTAGAGAAFKTAWDDLVHSPYGNESTLQSVRHVGRNL